MSSGIYGDRPEPYDPGENVPDRVRVPPKTIWTVTEHPDFNELPGRLISDLRGKKERDWFNEHFYFCLPITMGNQLGWAVLAHREFTADWNGGSHPSDLVVESYLTGDRPERAEEELQYISSHFGSGIITIQNRWTFRTEPGVNLLVLPPPNVVLDGLMCMTAVVETDWLRRDFTFNIKMTRPGKIEVRAGTPVGCVLPYPRGYLDGYCMELMPEGPELEGERATMQHYSVSRRDWEKGLPGLKYMRGEDIYGNKFTGGHQKIFKK